MDEIEVYVCLADGVNSSPAMPTKVRFVTLNKEQAEIWTRTNPSIFIRHWYETQKVNRAELLEDLFSQK